MNVFTINHNILVLVLSIAVLSGCNNSGNNNSAADESNPDIIKKEVILSTESEILLKGFPTPWELTRMLQDARAPYIFSLTNPPANVNRYFTEKTKSLNLGIYSTDLAYSSTYHRTGETRKFLYCTGKLAGDLGIAGVYDKRLVAKVNMQEDNRDSLVSLVKKIFGETGDFLNRNNRTQVAVLVAAGAFVEGLYISSSLCETARNNIQLAAAIYRQKENLDKLIRILGEYGLDSTVKPIADELAKLKPIFTDYGLGSGTSLPLQKAAAIVEIAERIRSSMIK